MGSTEPAARIRWEPEEVVPGLFRIPLPYTFASSVNVLAIPGPEGILLVDAGHDSEPAREAFDAQLRALGLRRADIRAVFLTHADHDHVGFARALNEETGARVLIHPLELDRGPLWRGSLAWLAANGYPGAGQERPPEPPALPDAVELVEDGAELAWAGFRFLLIHCPGHTPGLLCAFDERRRLLLSTDHVLRAAPTPVGLFGPDGDPLEDYLGSLQRLRGLPAEIVVPGHGRAFAGLEGRLDEVAAGREEELDRLRSALGPQPLTAWEIAERLHPGVDPQRRVILLFFVLAGLRRLERAGEAATLRSAASRSETGETISYRAA